MATKTQDTELRRYLRYWQKKLRLTDWDVTIRFASKKELGTDCQGINHWNEHTKSCAILVLEPAGYNAADYPNSPAQDIENTVVHELLHLHLAMWVTADGSAEETFLEQAIESITLTLLALKRRTR